MTFSIVIVNYNGKDYIDKCVSSIYESSIFDFEVIVVDNGSTDDSVSFLNERYLSKGNFRIVTLEKNFGPSYARNKGVALAKGILIGFLDNDTEVEKNWAINAKKYFDEDPKLGIVQCKLLLARERTRIDYVGEFIGQNGFLVQRASAGEEDNGQYDQPVKILAAKSAGMFIRRQTFIDAGGFDDDYFIYVEETDLGWRVWLAGYTAIFCPESIVYHEFGTSTIILGQSKSNYNAKFHGTKNYILTLLKDLELKNLLRILPVHLFLWIGLAFYLLVKGRFRPFVWILKGILWNFVNLKNSLLKRNHIQSKRKISDKKLFSIVMKNQPFPYFLRKATVKQKIGNAEGFIKSK